MTTIYEPPRLKADDHWGAGPIPARNLTERRLVWSLLKHLQQHGWVVTAVDDGGDSVIQVSDHLAVMEHVFSVDESLIKVRKGDGRRHAICFVLGNDGWDAISDCSCPDPDPDGFNAMMEAFDCEVFDDQA